MKFLLVLSAVIALCAGNAIPLIPGGNSHYVEGESRYIRMPDGEDIQHLVDQEAVDETASTERYGVNNQYWLFTRQNPNNHQIIVYEDVNSIWNSNYSPNRPTNVIVHGHNSNGYSEMNPLITSAFLAVQDCNVIVVDWHVVAGGPYTTSVSAVPSVGRSLGYFIQWVFNTTGGNWNNVHLVGFDLGAHVVSNAGRQVGGAPSRITGLDPAGPQWVGNPNALYRNAGQYVESIHTNAGVLGIGYPISDADFYPNGGRNQPGCFTAICSHNRAFVLFANSIRNDNYVGRQCATANQAENSQSTLNMGNAILTKRGSGIYCLATRGIDPLGTFGRDIGSSNVNK